MDDDSLYMGTFIPNINSITIWIEQFTYSFFDYSRALWLWRYKNGNEYGGCINLFIDRNRIKIPKQKNGYHQL